MAETFNIYCDESCHLQRDDSDVMVLGAVWCPKESSHEIARHIRAIKKRHGIKPQLEIKWVKVGKAKLAFYLDLLEYFFSEPDLHLRALVAKKKSSLCHEAYDQTHDDWYYRMYFSMLKTIFRPINSKYRIYVDIKDTKGASKVRKLHEVLCSTIYDFEKDIIERVQIVRSHDAEQIQLVDVLIGCIGYANRGLAGSAPKNAIVDEMRKRSRYSLTKSTLLAEQKVNLFCWQPKEIEF